jgi:hypothetical protein
MRVGDLLHHYQPARRRALMAGKTSPTGRSDQRVASIGYGGGRTGNVTLGAGEGQHGLRGLRGVRGRELDPRPDLARVFVSPTP